MFELLRILGAIGLCTALCPFRMCPDEIKVRYTEGLSRGFLVLRTPDGDRIADGDSSQVLRNGIVLSRLTFRFEDGSIYEDVTTFTERGTFRLLTEHMTQKGPTFPTQIETWIDTKANHVKVKSCKNGKIENIDETLQMPSDVANGILFTIVKSMLEMPYVTVSYVAFSPKPRIVKLIFTQEGKEEIPTDREKHEAVHFRIKADIGGVTGAMAAVMGKRPADTLMWVITGMAPTFAGSEGPLYGEGPVWRIELVSPQSKSVTSSRSDYR